MIVYQTTKKGDHNSQVVALQRSLPSWSKTDSFQYDGIFGDNTRVSVMNYQDGMNLSVDGVVGETTATSLGIWRDVSKGFDASHYQNIDWSNLDTNMDFAIFKATEGKTYSDPNFYESVQNARAFGMSMIGAYHFTHFSNSPFEEFENFYENCYNAQFVDSVFLDLEDRSPDVDLEGQMFWISTFMKLCSTFFQDVGIYTSSNYLREMKLQNFQELSKYNLWASDISSQPIVLPWDSWYIWQYTFEGSVQGISGDVDLNLKIRSV